MEGATSDTVNLPSCCLKAKLSESKLEANVIPQLFLDGSQKSVLVKVIFHIYFRISFEFVFPSYLRVCLIAVFKFQFFFFFFLVFILRRIAFDCLAEKLSFSLFGPN